MSEEKGETITKLALAKRQLSGAIVLFFENRDPATYFLQVFASHEIIKNIANAQGIKSILKDDFAEMVNEGCLDLFLTERYGKDYTRKKRNLLSKIAYLVDHDYNKSKHGGGDPNEEITIHWGTADIVILDSIEMLRLLGEKLTAEHVAYMVWIKKTQPGVYSSDNIDQALKAFENLFGSANDKGVCLRSIQELQDLELEQLGSEFPL